jgi:phosphoribosylformylglycinamidine synthase
LVSFATAVGSVEAIVSPEFKRAGNQVVVVRPALREGSVMPEAAAAVNSMNYVQQLIETGVVAAAATPGYGGFAETLFKMGLGNGLGLNMSTTALTLDDLFVPAYGSFVLEVPESLSFEAAPAGVSIEVLGEVTEAYTWRFASETFNVAPLQEAWEHALEGVFPYRSSAEEKAEEVPTLNYEGAAAPAYHGPALVGTEAGKPRVVIPVFPGTNCEFDSAAAFERAGARATTFVINNLTPEAVAESTRELARLIRESHMVMLPGGFSGGDEPDGSAKFITAFFRAPEVTEAVRELLQARDGLMLGICNGFQALVKLGLVPYGDIRPMDAECATLTFNNIGRHQSMLVRTRVASTMSPWMSRMQVGDIHTIAISHGEGKFVAPPTLLDTMVLQGQVAAQYVNAEGVPSMDLQANPNGSAFAIEAVTSPCGRVLGKMGHTERSGAGLYKNAFGNTYQPLIEGGVSYFL